MSKPTIYANCAAGCKWETVHKDDFWRSASHIKLHASDDGNFYLVGGKEYKIFAEKADNEFTCAVILSYSMAGETRAYTFAFTNADKYADSFVFRLLEASANDTTLTLVYEIAGIRYTETVEGSGFDLSVCKLYVSGATEVLLYNAEAKIVFEESGGLTEVAADEKYLPYPESFANIISYRNILGVQEKGKTTHYEIFNGSHGLKFYGKIIMISQAGEAGIKGQSNYNSPICPNMVSYATVIGLTENKITLTDEQKAAVMAWLGIDTLIESLTARIADLESKVNG